MFCFYFIFAFNPLFYIILSINRLLFITKSSALYINGTPCSICINNFPNRNWRGNKKNEKNNEKSWLNEKRKKNDIQEFYCWAIKIKIHFNLLFIVLDWKSLIVWTFWLWLMGFIGLFFFFVLSAFSLLDFPFFRN
jgi:hypothetical protein